MIVTKDTYLTERSRAIETLSKCVEMSHTILSNRYNDRRFNDVTAAIICAYVPAQRALLDLLKEAAEDGSGEAAGADLVLFDELH